jgi:hypothetical protein
MNEFDELYNQYFGNNKKKPMDVANDRINRIISLMNKLNSGGGFGGMSPDEEKLGEPTKTTTFERDGVTFEESTWETDYGTIVRITTKEDIEFTPDFFKKNNIPFGRNNRKEETIKELTLEEQLNIAVKSENYEEAAKIRDLIEKKENKEKASENLDNKGLPEKDEWNF